MRFPTAPTRVGTPHGAPAYSSCPSLPFEVPLLSDAIGGSARARGEPRHVVGRARPEHRGPSVEGTASLRPARWVCAIYPPGTRDSERVRGLLCVEHRAAAPAREAVAGDPDDIDVARPRSDPLLQNPPPEKSPPAPVRTMARTAGSAWARANAVASSARTACERPLTGGLLMVTTATGSLTPRSRLTHSALGGHAGNLHWFRKLANPLQPLRQAEERGRHARRGAAPPAPRGGGQPPSQVVR
jgi:hypothetical protein